MLMMTKSGRVDPDMAAIACLTSRQTILQAICRLRDQGLVIETHPTPPGPMRVQWYKLNDYSRPKAWNLLAWWSDPDPDTWARYTKQIPQGENDHDPAIQRIVSVEEAHTAALQQNAQPDIHQSTHAALTKAIRRTKL